LSDLDFEVDKFVVTENGGVDAAAPVFSAFSVPAQTAGRTFAMTITATDFVGITGYFIKVGTTCTFSVDLRLAAAGSATAYLVVEKITTLYTKHHDRTITLSSAAWNAYTGTFIASASEKVRVQLMMEAAEASITGMIQGECITRTRGRSIAPTCGLP
jgi:hypothetical protein